MIRCSYCIFVLAVFVAIARCDEKDELKINVVSKPEMCEVKTKKGDMLTMHYTGTLNDGTKFDSSSAKLRERTFLMIKPDGVQRGLVGKLIKKFEQKGFKLIGLKFLCPCESLLKKHYEEHSEKSFFPELISYMRSGPVVPMVWEGNNIIKSARKMIGSTKPSDCSPGTIRGDLGIDSGGNLIHGSDSEDSAKREIALWFQDNELVGWKSWSEGWVFED